MTDKSDQFRELPAIRSMLADPMKTSREIEDFKNRLKKWLDYSQLHQSIDNKLRISNDRYSEMLSSAIINNQRDYQDLSDNIENLQDTYQDVWWEMQWRLDDEIAEMQWLRKEMKIKNNIARRRVEQNEETNEYLDSIDQWTIATRRWIDQTNMSLEEMKNKISYDFSRTQNYLWSIESSAKRSAEFSYGTRIPEIKWIDELMENTDFEGKKTLLALYAKRLVDNGDDPTHPLYRVFSSYFDDYLRKNITSAEAKKICEEKKEKVAELEKEYIQQYDILEKEKLSKNHIFEELTPLRDKISKSSQWLITDEEIEFLDIYQEAKNAENITDLIHMWLLDDTTLEKLVRHQKIDTETTLELSRMLKMDEYGINPKLDLDGDIGRLWQLRAQTAIWNIWLKQRQTMLKSIEEWNKLTNISNELINTSNELTKITNEILLEVKNELWHALHNIWDVLQNIWDTITYWFNEITEWLENIRQVNENAFEELQLQTMLLEDIKNTLLNPLDTKANEFYTHWLYRAKLKNRKNAFDSFRKWLDEKSIHLWNLYGAGSAKKMLWEDKEAIKYFLSVYQILSYESKYEFASKIAFEIAKINVKYLRLKIAKTWLDQSISNDEWHMEAYLFKARLTKILGQKQEFETLLDKIYNKIVTVWKDFTVLENYEDILKYLHKPIDETICHEIRAWWTSQLLKILPRIDKIWYMDGTKTILWEVLLKNPMALKKSWIDVPEILQKDTSFFNKKYKEIALKQYSWANSKDLFALAYMWYQCIDDHILNQIIKIGLEFDIDYINLKNESDLQKKKVYIKNIKEKFYWLWGNAKYLLRDYLINSPNSLLNI